MMDLPRTFALGPFHFSPLGPECCDADFVAVTSSADLLHGLFGSEWPRGLTYARNHEDLTRHAREWDDKFAFAYVIRSEEGGYMGCAYVNPTPNDVGGRVYLWLRLTQDHQISDLHRQFSDWMLGQGMAATQWPIATPG